MTEWTNEKRQKVRTGHGKEELTASPVECGVIKPCPFCGEAPRVYKWDGGWVVHCENVEGCGVRPETMEAENKAEAEAIWNGRAL